MKPIKNSDVAEVEPLSEVELRIIRQVAKISPYEQEAYDAAYREKIWQEVKTGALISYARTHELTEI